MVDCNGTWETCTLRRDLHEEQGFTRDLVHDLGAPLRVLRQHHDAVVADKWQDEMLVVIDDSLRQMETMLADLNAYARTGHNDVEMTVVCLQEVFEQAVSMLPRGEFAALTNCRLEDVTMLGNRSQLVRVLYNLIDNARKYGATYAVVSVTGDPRITCNSDVWVVSVTDDGPGIPADKQEAVFQPLRRLHTWHEVPGTGLGLSVCRRIVEAHGGNIWVEDPPARGARFSFTLKAA
jgi:signal transduction histidine kinase